MNTRYMPSQTIIIKDECEQIQGINYCKYCYWMLLGPGVLRFLIRLRVYADSSTLMRRASSFISSFQVALNLPLLSANYSFLRYFV